MIWRGGPYQWGGGFGFLFMCFGAILVVLLVIGLIRLLTGGRHNETPPWASGAPGTGAPGATANAAPVQTPPAFQSPQEILRARFARGELTEAEYQRMKEVLGPDAGH